MVSISHAIEFWLSVWWCVAVRRCEGAKMAIFWARLQEGVKGAQREKSMPKKEKRSSGPIRPSYGMLMAG